MKLVCRIFGHSFRDTWGDPVSEFFIGGLPPGGIEYRCERCGHLWTLTEDQLEAGRL